MGFIARIWHRLGDLLGIQCDDPDDYTNDPRDQRPPRLNRWLDRERNAR